MKKKNYVRDDFDIVFYEGVVSRSPNYVEALIPLAEAYTTRGFYEKGLEIDERLSLLCKDDPFVFYNLGCSYALVGKKRKAIHALKKAIALGYADFAHMRKDTDLRCLHGDKEFENLFP